MREGRWHTRTIRAVSSTTTVRRFRRFFDKLSRTLPSRLHTTVLLYTRENGRARRRNSCDRAQQRQQQQWDTGLRWLSFSCLGEGASKYPKVSCYFPRCGVFRTVYAHKVAPSPQSPQRDVPLQTAPKRFFIRDAHGFRAQSRILRLVLYHTSSVRVRDAKQGAAAALASVVQSRIDHES